MKEMFQRLLRTSVLAWLLGFPVVGSAVSFSAGSATITPGATTMISVTTSGFSQVLNFQFTVQWNSSVLQYVSAASSGASGVNFGTGSTGSGKLLVSWDDPFAEGQTLSDGTTVFTIQLQAVGSNGTSSSVGFSDSPTPREVLVKVGNNLVTQTPSTSDGSVNVSKPKPTITWSNPAAITYGTALSSAQLNAVAYVPGTTTVLAGSFAYTPASGTVLGAGSQTLSVTFTPTDTAAYDNNTATATITVNKATPTLSWSNPSDISYGTPLSGTQLNATASFGGSSVPGTFVYAPAAGTVLNIGNSQSLSVSFSPTDSANYNGAITGATINVTKGNQTITFGALSNKTVGDPAFTVSATASSGLTVSFSIASGPATISGSTVTITGAGTVTVRASQAGNDNYNAAANVDQSFTVAKASQTITFGSLSGKTLGDAPFTVSATASSGLAVSFSIASGPATISGNTITLTGVGTVTVRAAQSGNDNYSAATSVDQSFAVAKGNQTISFGTLGLKNFGDAPFAVSATASSGLSVSFSIVSGPATISGNTITLTGIGTVTVRASQAGDANYNAAANVDQSFTVAKGSQTINFGALANKTFSDAAFTVSASASSGLAVGFTIVSGPATISGSTVTITGVGTVTVRASQGGSDNYDAAANVDQSFTAGQGNQSISFGALNNRTFGDVPFTVSATASSGLAVTFSIASGPATISGNTVTITGAGTIAVRASQAGDANYNAAANADQSFTVAKASQTIAFGSLADKTVGAAVFAVSATSSSGLAVSFSIASGPASISGNNVTVTGAGIVTVRAAQGGNENYNAAANVDQSLTVGKSNQSITFDALGPKTFGDAPFAVSATASSGLPVSFSIASGPATISGNTVTISGVGTVTVRAAQGGNDSYNAAPVADQSFTVSKGNQTINFPAINNRLFGEGLFNISASASSSLPVTYSVVSGLATIAGNTVSVNGVGNVTVRASQPGNDNFNAAADVDQSFTVGKGNQTISFGSLGGRAFGDAPFTVNASASSGFPVSFNIVSGPANITGNSITVTGVGNVTVRASQNGSDNYNAAPNVDQTFAVGKGSQTINFPGIGNRTYGEAPFGVSAAASSGLTVSFSVVSGPATVSGSTITITGAGSVTLRALQSGNDTYDPAPSADQSFTVAKASQSIAFNGLSNRNVGDVFTVTASASSGLPVNFTIIGGSATASGSTVTIIGAGTVTVRASQAGNDNYNAAVNADQSFVVGKSGQSISFAPLPSKSFGDAAFALAATASSGLPVNFSVVSGPASISGNNVTVTGVGLVTIRAAQGGDANYNAAPNVDQSFSVTKGEQTISFPAIGGKTFGDVPFPVNATASSGLAVSFSIVSGPATSVGNIVTITGAGTVTLRASQAGNDNFNPAPSVEQSFTVAKANQTIAFSGLSNMALGDPPFVLNAAASSSLPVSFAVASGPATVSGNTVTVTGVGAVIVRAAQTGNENYNAAPNADQIFIVGKGNQTIAFGTLSGKIFGDAPFAVAATASSTLPVSFNILSGPATMLGNTVSINGAGTVLVRAAQAGSDNFNPAPNVDQPFIVAKANQTIAFGALPQTILLNTPFPVSATASSGLPVGVAIVSGPAAIAGNSVTVTGVGGVTLRASQAGNENYNPAPDVDSQFTVGKVNQTIAFGPLAPKLFGDAPFSLTASASSGLPVSFSIVSGPAAITGELVTITGAGVVAVRAAQPGNDNFNAAANVDLQFTVNKAEQTITFDPLAGKVFGDAAFSVAGSASSGLPVSFSIFAGPASISGNTVTITDVGTVIVRAAQAGNENFNAAVSVDQPFTVARAINLPPTISAMASQSTQENTPAARILFTIADPDTPVTNLTVSATSSNVQLVPQANILLEGQAADRTITVTPATNRTGTATITLTVRDSAGGEATAAFELVVIESLRITAQPEGKTVLAGESVTFLVAASGEGPLRFQWRFNGAVMAGQTNASLVLNNVNASRAGDYSAQVSNAGSSTNSAIATLTVNVPVTITRQPQAQTVAAGARVSFDIEAAGTQPFSFQWQQNGANLAGATNAALVMAGATQADAGEYSVMVSNAGGSVSSARARLNVTVPLVITRQPQGQTVLAGAAVSFGVTVSGTEPNYQWRLNGSNLPGANSPTLAVNNVQAVNAGDYTVVVTNPFGSVTSAVANLRVNLPAIITAHPAALTLTAGQTANFNVTATGSAPFSYQWRFNGVDIPRATNAALAIPNVQPVNAGNYQITVNNIVGPVQSSAAALRVNVPVTMVEQPQSQTVIEGSSVAFGVAAAGTAPLTFQWQKNGVDVSGATAAVLTLPSARASDAANYRVVVRNAVGAVNSLEAVLRVLVPPAIQTQPSSTNVPVGATVTFGVQATGEAPLTFQWQKNGVNLAGATASSLTLNNVQAADAGNYGVVVQNAGGAIASDRASLTLILPALNPGSSAQTAPPPIESSEGTFDGGSTEIGGGLLARKNAPAAGERWFSWKAPSSGVATFSTAGSTFDTVMTIFTGTAANLTEVGSDDDRAGFFASQVAFDADQGFTYLINVKGFGGATGRIVVSFKLQTTAQKLPKILAQPQSKTVGVGSDITFSVQAQGTALSYQWLANGSAIPGATSPALTLRGADELDVAKYAARISTGAGASILSVESAPAFLQIGSEAAVAQDKFKKAPRPGGASLLSYSSGSLLTPPADGVLRGYAGFLVMTTFESMTEQGEPNHCDVTGGASQWVTYQAPANGVLRLSTEGSDFDTVIAVYSGAGTDFESLKLEGCDNNSARDGVNAAANVPVRAGTVYFIAVDGVKGASGTAKLTYELGQGPVISRQPVDQSVSLGSTATFSIDTTNTLSGLATNIPALSYQWLRDGLKIAGETNRSFGVASAQLADAAGYAVIVSTFAGSTTSTVARLTVNVPLTITSQPESQNVRAGERVSFSAAVSGTTPVAYQWRLNGISISGATNSTYELINAQAAQAGNYSFFAQNGAGSVTSGTATLTVSQAPVITAGPAALTASVGQRVTLSVAATGTAPLSYQWRFNGVNIAGATASTLELNDVQVGDAGDYTVAVSNNLDSVVSASARLQVNVTLILTLVPRSQTVTAGSSVVFSVAANGSGTLRYQWKFNGTNLSGATNANLALLNVQSVNAGGYTVLVSDSASSLESTPATLIVGSIPVLPAVSDVRMSNGTFTFQLTVPEGRRALIETSTDLVNWTRLTPDSIASGTSIVEDSQALNFVLRFYRAVLEELP
jgi:hypothetical protein